MKSEFEKVILKEITCQAFNDYLSHEIYEYILKSQNINKSNDYNVFK